MTGRTPLRILLAGAAIALLASCAGLQPRYDAARDLPALLSAPLPAYPAVRFAVLSDPHLYDPALGIEGAAFQEYLDNDRKLLPQSEEILDAALARVGTLGASFLLVPGDLTKDGEKQDHQIMARKLAVLSEKGINVYVVPGNHDVLNPAAFSYSGSTKSRVANVTPEEFAAIYGEAGYKAALYRDPGSLSYVAEPAPGLWLLAIDSASYAQNGRRATPATGGGFTAARVRWVEGMLAEARRRGKAVIAMLHHGAVEHFPGQEKNSGEYLVNDWREVSGMLAAYGVRVAFTGHFHAQDITLRKTADGAFLFDVETGSLASFPNPVRSVAITPMGTMTIRSSFIEELPSFAARGEYFWTFSRETLSSNITGLAVKIMKALGVRSSEASVIAPQITNAFVAHYRGDESFLGTEMLTSTGLGVMAAVVVGGRKSLVAGLWHDLAPADNDVSLDLAETQGTAAP
jgi:3',5'-cyclic AMP phosphodiesterase CpdA